MNETVLCVDDEVSMLTAYRRFLASSYTVDTAVGGEAALTVMAARGPFAVVVSDLHMPGMSGIELLASCRAQHPQTVRLLLTGNADLGSAIQAVNDGHIFRFLTKPCNAKTLISAVEASVEQYRLVTAQRDLLENTLRAAIRVLGEVLAMVNPVAFGRADRVRQLVRDLARAGGLKEDWAVDIAAMLSQLGCIAVPESVLTKADKGELLTEAEQRSFLQHPTVGFELLRSIPRLERVAAIVAHQDRRYSTSETLGGPLPNNADHGAGLLKVALDFDTLLQRGLLKGHALEELMSRVGYYDPVAITALESVVRKEVPLKSSEIPVSELVIGMVTAADVFSTSGNLLVKKGMRITETMKIRLQSMEASGTLTNSIAVMVPDDGK